jgi:tripartite-type tricarboxylate transporter receptor subunit TctC
MRIHSRLVVAAGLAAAVASVGALPVAAATDAVANFYRGKQIKLVVSAGAGGSYGLYARLLAEYIGKHIPGNPSVVTQFMPGGGGTKASNYLHNAAPRDGTYMGMVLQNVPMFQFLRPRGAKFDVTKWQWIGNMSTLRTTLAVWHTAPATTIAAAKKAQVIMGATGNSSETFMNPTLLNALIGTKFKVIKGYRGVADIDKALEAGEVQGRGGSWLSWKARKAQWIKDGKIIQILQVGLDPDPDLPDVPLMSSLAENDLQRRVFEYMAFSTRFGRSAFFPPGVPKDRLAAMRIAFQKTMKDPEFLAAAKSRNAIIEPMSAAEVEENVRKTANAAPEILGTIRKALGFK